MGPGSTTTVSRVGVPHRSWLRGQLAGTKPGPPLWATPIGPEGAGVATEPHAAAADRRAAATSGVPRCSHDRVSIAHDQTPGHRPGKTAPRTLTTCPGRL